MTIEEFQDENRFLSSMYRVQNGVETPDGIVVSCVEIGYQADKFDNPMVREAILATTSGYEAKKFARELEAIGVPKRPDWEEVKLDVMRWYVQQKFERNPDIADRLRKTGDQELIEGNHWRDRFWGVSPPGSRRGQNWLGRILMEQRSLLNGTEASISHKVNPTVINSANYKNKRASLSSSSTLVPNE